MKRPVVAVFDVGKTNKKLFLFDERYNIVFERSARFMETVDEDGFPCENLESLRLSVFDSLHEVFRKTEFEIKAINFSTYGASLVYLDEDGRPLTPLYNYLKPYPEALSKQFYSKYGGEEQFSHRCSSPVLGSLNSGMQLYRIKYEQPQLFARIKSVLHLPQYMSYLVSGKLYADLTSIGCHTNLWDFENNTYHHWLEEEGLLSRIPPIAASDVVFPATFPGNSYAVGTGLHDSSAALIPYLRCFTEPFVLISTGTWCISFNPFNGSPLTKAELESDCLCYMQYQGTPVKASRLFAGYEHEQELKRIADHFNRTSGRFRHLPFDQGVLDLLDSNDQRPFSSRNLADFRSDIEAYYALMLYLVSAQKKATRLVLNNTKVTRIFVDGGFSKNAIYMNLLSQAFPEMEVYAAAVAQATAVGTALAIHDSWNPYPVPTDLIALKFYAAAGRNKMMK